MNLEAVGTSLFETSYSIFLFSFTLPKIVGSLIGPSLERVDWWPVPGTAVWRMAVAGGLDVVHDSRTCFPPGG